MFRIYRLLSDALEPFEPRTHPQPWQERRSRRWRRHLARENTRDRRGARRIAGAIQRRTDPLPDVVRYATPLEPWPLTERPLTISLRDVRDLAGVLYRAKVHTDRQCGGCSVECIQVRRHIGWIEIMIYTDEPERAGKLATIELARLARDVRD